MLKSCSLLLALCLSLLDSSAFASVQEKSAEPDFEAATKEATDILSNYLKIDTTNPPGNETLGAKFLADVLKKNGIEAALYETAPNRSCVYARLKGSGKKKPVVLLNHIDVVPANAADWKYPPFSGEVHDGELWGRGSLDMKGMGVIELEAMLLAKRSGKTLDRDIIFLGTPDEETSGIHGAKWIKENHPELVKDAEFLINEGFHIDTTDDGKVKYWGVSFGEKNILWLKITAKGEAGHASMPFAESAPNRLIAALSRLQSNLPAPHLIPQTKDYFEMISATESGELKKDFADISNQINRPEFQRLIASDRAKSAMLRDTVSLTVLNGGYKTNVIPAEASAQIDCRLLPDTDKEAFIKKIKDALGDNTLEVTVIESESAEPSPSDTVLFKTIKSIANEEMPGVPVVPILTQWFTDSHWFRDLGIVSYGFEPIEMDPEHLKTVHGKNERIPLKQLDAGIGRIYKLLERL